MHACIHTYIHTYIHTCMHTYIHTYIHTYTHIYQGRTTRDTARRASESVMHRERQGGKSRGRRVPPPPCLGSPNIGVERKTCALLLYAWCVYIPLGKYNVGAGVEMSSLHHGHLTSRPFRRVGVRNLVRSTPAVAHSEGVSSPRQREQHVWIKMQNNIENNRRFGPQGPKELSIINDRKVNIL